MPRWVFYIALLILVFAILWGVILEDADTKSYLVFEDPAAPAPGDPAAPGGEDTDHAE